MNSTKRSCSLLLAAICLPLLVPGLARAGALVDNIDLALGRSDEDNVLTGPVFAGEVADPVYFDTITSAIPSGDPLMRFPKNNGKVKSLKYSISPNVDAGALVTRGLQDQARVMGLRVATSPGEGWRVGGELRRCFFEYRVVPFGPILFFGRVELALTAQHADGRSVELPDRYWNYTAIYNGGFGAADEVGEATSQLLFETSQEAVARLNRLAVRAPASQAVRSLLEAVRPTNLEDQAIALRRIGLSGLPEAAPRLLQWLAGASEDDDRVEVIDALANLGVAEQVGETLAAAYPASDDDVRFFILKALDYVGAPELEAVAQRWSKLEGSVPVRRMAETLAAAAASGGS